MMIGKVSDVLHGLMPVLFMTAAQVILAGVNVMYKLAAADQFKLSILVAYRFLFSSACIVPTALVVERNKTPKLTWTILFELFVCAGLGGSIGQNLFAKCLVLTSPTFASALFNLVPGMTFILALIFRLEKLGWRTVAGKAKMLGTLLGIGGAMLFTLYKGPEIHLWKSNVDLVAEVRRRHSQHVTVATQQQHSTNMVFGAILGLCCAGSNALSIIVQGRVMLKYPCPYSASALYSAMAFVQGLVYALCTERDWSQWKLGWNIRLLIVAYTGIVGSAVLATLAAWCLQMRGPLFVSSFNPMVLVVTAIAGLILLNEKLDLGSVLGAILIVCGLYAVLWGKGKELKKMLQLVSEGNIALPEKDVSDSKRVLVDINSSSHCSIGTSDQASIISVCDESDDEVSRRDIRGDIAKK